MEASTKKKSSKLIRAQRIEHLINQLMASARGQIFITNMLQSLPMLDARALGDILAEINPKDIRGMTEGSLLGFLCGQLQSDGAKLHLANPRRTFDEFAPNGWITNVLTLKTFSDCYQDASYLVYGHAALNRPDPGALLGHIDIEKTTRKYFWAAPVVDAFPTTNVNYDAEKSRNLIGLVHYGANLELVAMKLRLRDPTLFRPTIIEANPNVRFRQTDPHKSTETRWGRTVDLAKLTPNPLPADIGGVRELLVGQIRLCDADEIEFRYLGSTITDQSTTTSDERFLAHLLSGDNIENVVFNLLSEII